VKHESEMTHIRDYLSYFKDMNFCKLFQKVGAIFCDGMIFPRLH